MSHDTFDAIVLGVGGMGSATVFELARRGRRVLGLEQFPLGHDQGSSHGHTRIIRKAYYEHPDYVPLVFSRSRRHGATWSCRCGRPLLTEHPCLSSGRPDGELIRGVRQSAEQHRLSVEALDADGLRRRFPAFCISDDYAGLLEHSAGFLYVDDCMRAHADEARKLGAVIRDGEPVVSWRAEGGGVVVETTGGRYTAGRLVITAGPWAGRMIGDVGARLTVMRQVVFWLGGDEAAIQKEVFPIFIAETPEGAFYGLPALNADGVKVGRHYGAPELREPSEVSRTISEEDEAPVRQFLRAHLPAADGPRRRASVCIYTLTPDRHFLIDIHPRNPQVVFAAGFSGHGFKFAPVVGEILADLAEGGRTTQPIGMFRLR